MKIGIRYIVSVVWLLVAFLPIFLFLVMMWKVRWIGDDGLINTRVVQNILDGFGPVYNVGERVEAFTSPLWIGVLTIFGLVGIRPDAASVYLGLVTSMTGMLLAVLGSSRLTGREGKREFRCALPLGMLVYAALPPAWDYGTSGLETGLALAWLGGTYFYLSTILSKTSRYRLEQSKLMVGYVTVLGLGPLIRPELSIFSMGFMVPILVGLFEERQYSRFGWRSIAGILRLGLFMAILPVAYQVFRMGYYASLTSNTALAKEAFRSNWEQGWHYFHNFFGLYYLVVPILALSVFLAGKLYRSRSWTERTALFFPVVSGAVYTIFVVKVGGDFMHGRFFLPGVFGGLMSVALVFPTDIGKTRLHLFASAILGLSILGWASYCASSLRMPMENQHNIGDERGWYTRRSVTPNPTTVRDYRSFTPYKDAKKLKDRMRKDCSGEDGYGLDSCVGYVLVDKPHYGRVTRNSEKIPLNPESVHELEKVVVMRGGIGIFGTVAGRHIHVVDRYGLLDPVGSRMLLTRRGRPGHEKAYTNAWVIARFADRSAVDDKNVEILAQVLRCAPLSDLIEAVTRPLTFSLFWSNLKNSFQFQKLRVPPRPLDAREQFCR